MNSCLNYTEDCDNAMICPCLEYKCKYTNEELTEHKIDNKPNPSMPKNYDELKIVNHPKHIVVNGALYEKIDDVVITIASGYYEV